MSNRSFYKFKSVSTRAIHLGYILKFIIWGADIIITK